MGTKPQIVGRRRAVPASSILDALGKALAEIKDEDGLTLEDLGAVLGKSDDQAGKYILGTADMGVVSYHRGMQAWNGRFTNRAAALVQCKVTSLDPAEQTDRASLSALTRLLLQMSVALENDDAIDDEELAAMGAELENAGQAIDRLRERRRFRPESVA